MEEDFNLKFETTFKITSWSMRFNGTHPDLPKNLSWMCRVTFIGGIFLSVFVLLANSLIFHDAPAGNTENISRTGVMAMISMVVSFKYCLLIWFRKEKMWLLEYIDADYEASKALPKNEQQLIIEYSKKGKWVCKLWLYSAIAASCVFPLKSIVLMIFSYLAGEFEPHPMFEFTYPSILEAHKNEPVMFLLMFAWCVTFGVFAPTVYSGFDPLAPIFMLHTCSQLDLISERILNLFPEENFDPKVAKESLRKIVIQLQSLYGFVECIQKTTSLLYEFTMKITTFLIPFTAYEITNSMKKGVINIEFMAMEFACLIHFFVPCYYSNMLMVKGESIYNAVYASRWETQKQLEMRKTLHFVLVRSSRQLAIRSVFWTISLEAFAEMCRQSYTIFSLMNAAWG